MAPNYSANPPYPYPEGATGGTAAPGSNQHAYPSIPGATNAAPYPPGNANGSAKPAYPTIATATAAPPAGPDGATATGYPAYPPGYPSSAPQNHLYPAHQQQNQAHHALQTSINTPNYDSGVPAVHNDRRIDRRLGGLGVLALAFLFVGIFMPILWIPLVFLPICAARSGSLRTKSVVKTCAIIAFVALIVYVVIAVVIGVLASQGRWSSHCPYGFQPQSGVCYRSG